MDFIIYENMVDSGVATKIPYSLSIDMGGTPVSYNIRYGYVFQYTHQLFNPGFVCLFVDEFWLNTNMRKYVNQGGKKLITEIFFS